MQQRFLYKCYFIFCTLMRPAITFLKSKNFRLFVKKRWSLLYPDRYSPACLEFTACVLKWSIGSLKKGSVSLKRKKNKIMFCYSHIGKVKYKVSSWKSLWLPNTFTGENDIAMAEMHLVEKTSGKKGDCHISSRSFSARLSVLRSTKIVDFLSAKDKSAVLP